MPLLPKTPPGDSIRLDTSSSSEKTMIIRRPDAQSHIRPSLTLVGTSRYISLPQLFSGIACGSPTGLLTLTVDGRAADLYLRGGLPALITTHQPDWYLRAGDMEIPDDFREYFESLLTQQRRDGHPVFLQMLRDDILPADQAIPLLRHYGNWLIGQLWTAPEVRFSLDATEVLPPFVPEHPYVESMDDWLLEALRTTDPAAGAIQSCAGASDIPAFTASGYSRIQNLNLDADEVALATAASDGNLNLEEIAASLGTTLPSLAPVLYRLIQLRILELWPSG